MSEASPLLYTNEVSPEFLRSLDNLPFTEQQLADFDEQALAAVNKQQAYYQAHPAIAIYRMATEGSQTRNGGIIQGATSPLELKLANGQRVRAAQKGDHAVYADGTQAQIVTTAGSRHNHVALVGSTLSNGDAIINTPQDHTLLLTRDGILMPEDFLSTSQG